MDDHPSPEPLHDLVQVDVVEEGAVGAAAVVAGHHPPIPVQGEQVDSFRRERLGNHIHDALQQRFQALRCHRRAADAIQRLGLRQGGLGGRQSLPVPLLRGSQRALDPLPVMENCHPLVGGSVAGRGRAGWIPACRRQGVSIPACIHHHPLRTAQTGAVDAVELPPSPAIS